MNASNDKSKRTRAAETAAPPADKPLEAVAIRALTPDARNANRGTERGGALIERSLRTLGAGRSIVIDRHGRVIAGNKTLESAALIGLDDTLIVESDGTKLVAVRRIDLDLESPTDSRARELALMDNRTAQLNLEWDAEALESLGSLDGGGGIDLSAMFTDAELDALIRAADGAGTGACVDAEAASGPESFPSVDESLETTYCCPKCGYEWSGKPK